MIVLALDQAPRHTGYCYGEADILTRPVWGTKDFESYGENEQLLMRDYEKWFVALIERARPDKIYFEQVIVRKFGFDFKVFYQQVAVVCTIMFVAMKAGIDAEQIDISVWRARGLGKANKPKWASRGEDDWLKEAAKMACFDNHGWLIEDHNAAEAALIWDYGSACASREYRGQTAARAARVRMAREEKDREHA